MIIDKGKALIVSITTLLGRLNKTPVKRILLYVAIVYPLFFGFYYKQQIIKYINSDEKDKQVKVRNIAKAETRAMQLRKLYNAEAVMLYVYQPNTNQKTVKQRFAMSVGNIYKPIEQNNKIQLVTRTHVIQDLRDNGYSEITASSKHVLSNILFSYNLSKAYVVPIKDPASNSIIGEVIYVFSEEIDVDVNALIASAQMFTYDIY